MPEAVHAPLGAQDGIYIASWGVRIVPIPHLTPHLLKLFLVPTVPFCLSGNQMLTQNFYWRVKHMKGKWSEEETMRTNNVSVSPVGWTWAKIYVRGKLTVCRPLLSFNCLGLGANVKVWPCIKAKADLRGANSWRLSDHHVSHSWAVSIFLKGDLQATSSCLPDSHKLSASLFSFFNLVLIVTINSGIGSLKCCPWWWRCYSPLGGRHIYTD